MSQKRGDMAGITRTYVRVRYRALELEALWLAYCNCCSRRLEILRLYPYVWDSCDGDGVVVYLEGW